MALSSRLVVVRDLSKFRNIKLNCRFMSKLNTSENDEYTDNPGISCFPVLIKNKFEVIRLCGPRQLNSCFNYLHFSWHEVSPQI